MRISRSGGDVTNTGTFVVQEDGALLTSSQLIDNIVAVDDDPFSLGTGSGSMMMAFAGTQSVDANDAGAIAMDTDGAIHIADGGNTITVDGTVTADAGTNLNTSALLTATQHDAAFGTAGSADAQVRSVQGVASMTALVVDGSAVTQPVSGVVTLGAATAEFGKLAAGTAAIGSLTAGTAEIGKLAAGVAVIGSTFLGAATTAVGTTTFTDLDLDEAKIEVTDNPTSVIYGIAAFNATAAPLFLQMWDLDADSVTVGTTAPTNQYLIPGNADSDGAGFIINFVTPKKYTTGFTVACTTDSAGSAAPATNACSVNIEYIT